MDAGKNEGFATVLNQSSSGLGIPWNSGKKKTPQDEAVYIPLQWNNSYSSFVHQINYRTWKIQGETIAIRNSSFVQVPALIIEVAIVEFFLLDY